MMLPNDARGDCAAQLSTRLMAKSQCVRFGDAVRNRICSWDPKLLQHFPLPSMDH